MPRRVGRVFEAHRLSRSVGLEDSAYPTGVLLDACSQICEYDAGIDTAPRRRKLARKRRLTSDAVEILHRRYYEGKPKRLAALEEARANDEVARQILALRTEAGLTQRRLAKLVGTTASVICRLEDADYEGHSLAMLRRIAAALQKRIEIRFLPARSIRTA